MTQKQRLQFLQSIRHLTPERQEELLVEAEGRRERRNCLLRPRLPRRLHAA